ncbi:hypothetical protein [Thermoactinospora rubra]|uniref:hypothetical protein n=1 Tax=Thermoactinospora rubra TaxID=1088767 RepID=UPI000A0FA0DB|nr:hypothetical protein [Thermoactinospora rubra]
MEKADQLVLSYVSKAADLARGRLRPEQRLDFVNRLRARIEQERGGSQDARDVAKVLSRFGDPKVLVEREVRRLTPPSAEEPPTAPLPPATVNPAANPAPAGNPAATVGLAASQAAAVGSPAVPPGVALGRRLAQEQLARRHSQRGPVPSPSPGAMRSPSPGPLPQAAPPRRRDIATIMRLHTREVTAMAVLLAAALAVPLNLGAVAIFQVPVLIWAIGTVLLLASETWPLNDRVTGLAAPMAGYTVGGALVAALRAGGDSGLDRFLAEFWTVSGVMFMIGTALGLLWLGYRLVELS